MLCEPQTDVPARIARLLRSARAPYAALTHPPVITSQEAREVRGAWADGAVALKALVVRVEPKAGEAFLAMVVVPGEARFSSSALRRHFAAREVRFIDEAALRAATGGVPRGGVPPLGSVLWGMPLVADASLRGAQTVVFNAGDRSASVILRREDWERIAAPVWVERLCAHEGVSEGA
ncbi:MAG: hypothetical protein KatS3mg099_160 [Candidatus Parcubacteria bacterium]|nr:MAG: hypothetical protein KatS3mg099_160 [Candidatus Parcubacteria bacterium]